MALSRRSKAIRSHMLRTLTTRAGCLSVFATVSILLMLMRAFANEDQLVVSGFTSRNAIGHPRSGIGRPKVLRRRGTDRRRSLQTGQLMPKVMYRHLLAMLRMVRHRRTPRQTRLIQMTEMRTTTRLTAERTKVNLPSLNCLPCQETPEPTVRNHLRKA
jgi:hypothetical protein